MKRKITTWLIIALATLLLVACSTEGKGEKPETLPSKEDKESMGTTYTFPFTGISSEEETTRRPVLATINNHPLARPQSGISDADIVYEFVAEGNVTRLLALFQSELPEQIGPIRSARDYFVEVAKGLDAFYVAHGYSPDALALLQSGYVDSINGMQYDGTLFKRSTDRKAPHNSYISGENILKAEQDTNASMEMNKAPSLSFHESIESAKIGDSASEMEVRNGSHPNFTSTYSYNEEKGSYRRTVNDIVTIDQLNDKEVEVSNVIVFQTAHRTIDDAGRQVIDLESGGKGLLFQAGVAKEIEWKNIDGILTPIENGVTAKLVPGKTWIHVVPTQPDLDALVTFTP
ncbi:DUF3048 domain-containing protein [Sporosarcina sp. G11-34]|uniref:DUF3048 domain-containing protein n=1 Tax=Sporosarcina sp. G11-34 TaxID=2849605 RepID=UPI0022A9C392|nr:DUF3048 domain-containing protein [Sporosarcina sp. G11-34]MCZ2260185.1 DUF3048 domain-containing protein [Sporosarcina sp. G11-34]